MSRWIVFKLNEKSKLLFNRGQHLFENWYSLVHQWWPDWTAHFVTNSPGLSHSIQEGKEITDHYPTKPYFSVSLKKDKENPNKW